MEQPVDRQHPFRDPRDRPDRHAARLHVLAAAEGRDLHRMSYLQVQGLAKRYPGKGGGSCIFEGVDFAVEKGEFVCIIGHSGCGKTTILNILAGLDAATLGEVVMDGREVSGPSLDRGVVFQGHALMPWLTVMGNIAFGVRSRWPEWNRERVR